MTANPSPYLTSRERLLRLVRHEPVDRGIFWPEQFWAETLARWQQEGMPADWDFGFDFDNTRSLNALGINIGFCPPFDQEILADEGPTQVVRDEYGIIKRVRKDQTGMPQFLKFPVHDRSDWAKIKQLLDPATPGRFPADWGIRVETLKRADDPISFTAGHLTGFFGFLRELCGDRLYYLFYDDPGLVHEILDFQAYRLTTFVRRISQDVRIDRQCFWEDMGYKAGPLIGPKLFEEFLLEPYARTIALSRQCGVQVFDVDSDGNVEQLIPLWLEAGVNMLHPFEVAAGMDVVKSQRAYGQRLVIRGNVDKRALAAGRQAIDREMERIRSAYEAGGYIPHVDHAVPPDVSWDSFQYYLEKKRRLVGAASE